MLLSAAFAPSEIVLLFAGAGLILYVSSRAAVDAVSSTTNQLAGRIALGHWMPIAWCAAMAALMGHPDIAVGVVFATSVAGLGMVLGVLLCISPTTQMSGTRTDGWTFVVPGAVLALMAGFAGSLSLVHAAMLLGAGVMVARVWRGPRDAQDPARMPYFADKKSIVQMLLAFIIGGLGSWLILRATVIADEHTRLSTSGLIAVVVVSPLLMLPVLGAGALIVHNGRLGVAFGVIVGIVLLNLFLLLPLITVCHYLNQIGQAWLTHGHSLPPLRELDLHRLPYPLAVWRIDTVLLVVLGLLIAPVAIGRWTLHRLEGVALAFVYAVYLLASTALAMRF